MNDQYMKSLFSVYVGNYELQSGVVLDSVGDLEWVIDKLFSYGITDYDLLDFLHSLWDGETTDWDYQLAEPFTVSIELIRSES